MLSDFTVGITTNYGKENLIETIKSLRQSRGVYNFPIIVIADTVKISKDIKKELVGLEVKIVENTFSSSLVAKQKQLVNLVKTSFVLLTHDDLIYESDTVLKLVQKLNTEEVTFVNALPVPVQAKSFEEKIISVGNLINMRIAKKFNRGDNYLAAVGRMMGFKTEWIKNKIRWDDSVTSSDAYLYFENKRLGGRYACVWDAKLYFRSPNNLKEYFAKSYRFQSIKSEMEQYNKFKNLDREFEIPKMWGFIALWSQFFSQPVATVIYLGFFVYTRFTSKIKQRSKAIDPMWEVEVSTKNV